MRIKAQGDQAQCPQGRPELHLSQPLCQKGREIGGVGFGKAPIQHKQAPWWLSGANSGDQGSYSPEKSVHSLFFPPLAAPCGLQDLSSLTRDQTQAPAVKVPSPNHWTTKEFPFFFFFRPFLE